MSEDSKNGDKQSTAKPSTSTGGTTTARPAGRQGSGSAGVLAALAFLLSLALLAAAWWYWEQSEERLAALETLQSELDQQQDRLEGHERALDRLRDLPQRSDRLSDAFDDMTAHRQRIERDLERLDERTETLREFMDAGRSAWRIAEVEYLLRRANRELQLAGKPVNALAALDAADERLEALADPGMTPVREAISRDRERLRALEQPDVTGLALTLGSLIERVDRLPLADGVQRTPQTDLDEDLDAENFWPRLRERSTRVLRQLVTVRHEDVPLRPLLAPEQEYFLRRNLALSLATARLALLREQPEVWRASLLEARDWLDGYFAMEEDAVQAVDEELARLSETTIRSERPDISESLERLRRVVEARN
ncbi:uroporphyrinogen-III C-methyltransferase [Natronospira bacteriovora]|uniref:Uroporphyrinogen-III C-methyltransferase n=1 Tax=Natronospira bacteriovora TaxID=3069753 RepID=A0ABU0W759_9GAMM|nr:uroporphyrinogen-III C-methyltransferase [Natronospira sp. AB-CW4]MDQ2069844.1 uroporphyrinogen-III C-methyltransferase [Natronospira sp. AB-CW4]